MTWEGKHCTKPSLHGSCMCSSEQLCSSLIQYTRHYLPHFEAWFTIWEARKFHIFSSSIGVVSGQPTFITDILQVAEKLSTESIGYKPRQIGLNSVLLFTAFGSYIPNARHCHAHALQNQNKGRKANMRCQRIYDCLSNNVHCYSCMPNASIHSPAAFDYLSTQFSGNEACQQQKRHSGMYFTMVQYTHNTPSRTKAHGFTNAQAVQYVDLKFKQNAICKVSKHLKHLRNVCVWRDNEAQGHSSQTKLGLLPCGVGCVYCCASVQKHNDGHHYQRIATPHQKVTGFAPKGYRGRNKRLEGSHQKDRGSYLKVRRSHQKVSGVAPKGYRSRTKGQSHQKVRGVTPKDQHCTKRLDGRTKRLQGSNH